MIVVVLVDWMRRQPQARETKQKARIEAFYKLEKSTKPRVKDPTLELNDDGQRRLGGNILKVSFELNTAKAAPITLTISCCSIVR